MWIYAAKAMDENVRNKILTIFFNICSPFKEVDSLSNHSIVTNIIIIRDNNIFLWDTRSPSDTNPENIIR